MNSTPWGRTQSYEVDAPGIVRYFTASHGGYRVSAERLRQMPAALRRVGRAQGRNLGRGGWFEEDVEAYAVEAAFPDVYGPDRAAFAEEQVRQWFPDEYEQWRGVTLKPGQSRARDEQVWREQHRDDHVVISAVSTDGGMVEVTTTVGGQRTGDAYADAQRWLVPADEYDKRSPHGFVVDPDRHQPAT